MARAEMSELDARALGALEHQVKELLAEHPSGTNEFTLIRALRGAGATGFDEEACLDSLGLFRAHFMLFHVLYQIRDALRAAGSGDLEISALSIKPVARALPRSQAELGAHDALREYYMDLSQLRHTTSREVEALLNNFWQRIRHHEQRAQALAVLGLDDPASYEQVRQRYRTLAYSHHPDRGGDVEMLRLLNQAMAVLGEP